jgi:hypothetical protein
LGYSPNFPERDFCPARIPIRRIGRFPATGGRNSFTLHCELPAYRPDGDTRFVRANSSRPTICVLISSLREPLLRTVVAVLRPQSPHPLRAWKRLSVFIVQVNEGRRFATITPKGRSSCRPIGFRRRSLSRSTASNPFGLDEHNDLPQDLTRFLVNQKSREAFPEACPDRSSCTAETLSGRQNRVEAPSSSGVRYIHDWRHSSWTLYGPLIPAPKIVSLVAQRCSGGVIVGFAVDLQRRMPGPAW